MKKTVSTPCALGLMSCMFIWMGIAEGWSECVIFVLFAGVFLCTGVTAGGLAYSFKREVIDRKGGE